MKIAILGSGNVGSALATGWVKAGHEVVIAARNPDSEKTKQAAAQSGAAVMAIGDACVASEVILLATPWAAVDEAVKSTGGVAGKVVLDATNPLKPQLAGIDVRPEGSGAEYIQSLAPEARVVKVFNTIGAKHLTDGHGLTMFYCGDSEDAKSLAAQLAKDVGFEPQDAGPLNMAATLEHFAFLWINLAFKRGLGPDFGLSIVR